MGLFNFGKPKDEVLENKIEGLKQKLDKQKLELQQLKEEKQLLLYLLYHNYLHDSTTILSF